MNAMSPMDEMHRPLLDLHGLAADLQGPVAAITLQSEAIHRIRLRVMEDYVAPWHVHAVGAEIFYVIQGRFWLDFDDGSVEVAEGRMLRVPPGTRHRARAEARVTLLVADGFEP